MAELFIKRPVMTCLVMLAILLFGVVAYRALPVSDWRARVTRFPVFGDHHRSAPQALRMTQAGGKLPAAWASPRLGS